VRHVSGLSLPPQASPSLPQTGPVLPSVVGLALPQAGLCWNSVRPVFGFGFRFRFEFGLAGRRGKVVATSKTGITPVKQQR
jgi:hypothetical protein